MQTYDFIIVGSGSAGSVVAERLSASGRFSVLVLEAGGTDRRFFVQMPLGYGKTFFDPAVNWNYKTEPDPGLAGNADHWPRGKLLGGSSSINAMVWIRGAREDFDAWAAAGNPGWSHDDLLPAFRAIEDNEAGADQWRGRDGPVHITDNRRFVHPLTERFDRQRHRRAADALDMRIDAQRIAHLHRLGESHLLDRRRHHPAPGALGGANTAGKVHLRHNPTTENIARRIGIGWHGQCPQCQFAVRLPIGVSHHACSPFSISYFIP